MTFTGRGEDGEARAPFGKDENLDGQRRTHAELQALDLDALQLFEFEDMYRLCGYESDGFYKFGCM